MEVVSESSCIKFICQGNNNGITRKGKQHKRPTNVLLQRIYYHPVLHLARLCPKEWYRVPLLNAYVIGLPCFILFPLFHLKFRGTKGKGIV